MTRCYNLIKKLLKMGILLIPFFLIVFFGSIKDVSAAYFKYADFDFDTFAKQNLGYWTYICSDDAANENEVKDMIKNIINEFEKIDVLVNNAGIVIDKEFEDRTVEDWKKTLNVNLIAPFIVSKYVGKEMLKSKSGKIINISSTNGIDAFFPTSIDYDASKAGLINLTHNLAIQFAPYINVNCVAPGWVNTDMNKDLPKELVEEETNRIYKKRFAEPSEIAKVVTFLASNDADFINDEIIKVDGGY